MATFLSAPLFAVIKQPVRTAAGLVAGMPGKDPSVTVFKGIPYAAPPLREMCWKAPAPTAGWRGIRKADAFGPSCIQTIVQERKPWTYEFMTHGELSSSQVKDSRFARFVVKSFYAIVVHRLRYEPAGEARE